jgi:hypothetical protein
VPRPAAGGKGLARLGEEHAAIGPRVREPLALEASDRLDGGGVGDAEAAGDVRRALVSRSSISST